MDKKRSRAKESIEVKKQAVVCGKGGVCKIMGISMV